MPLKLSTPTLLLAGLLWFGPGLEIPANAKGLLSFGSKKESVAKTPRAPSGTVYLTKYGPLTAAQYQARLELEKAKVNEAVRRAAEQRAIESKARQKSAERAAREKALASTRAGEERARADRLAAKKKEAQELAAKKLEARKVAEQKFAAKKKAEADRARAEKEAAEKRRLASLELKAQKTAEKREKKAVESRTITSPSRTPAANLSPAERMKEMERVARDLAEQRKSSPAASSSAPKEIASASSLGLTKATRASAPKKTAASASGSASGSKIERLNKSIFDIVRQRRAAATDLRRVGGGELYLTTKKRTPFYYFNPLQLVVPDLFIDNGTQVALLKRGKIWSDVRLEDGKEGVIANDFLAEAPVVEIELPVENLASTSSGGSTGFRYTEVPKNYVPPELPIETGIEDRTPSPLLLLPPLRPEAETP